MNTESISEPTAPPIIQTLELPSEPSQPKRLHRKIGKLPKPLRDLINTMLDDNIPTKDIIIKLNQSSDPLPYSINEMDISRWKTTGYMRYLAHQDHLDSIEASREAALEMVANNDNLSLPQATLQVIASQCFEILADFSTAAVKQELAKQPLKYTSFLHVFARLTREMVHVEKFIEARAAAQAEKSDPNRDKEAEAAEFWSGHIKALFNRKDPNRIKKTEPAPTPKSDPVSSSSSSSSNPPHASRITHNDSVSHTSHSSHHSHPESGIRHPESVSPPSTPEPRPSCAPQPPNPESSIEHPESVLPTSYSTQHATRSPDSSVQPFNDSTRPSEHCLDCGSPLPPVPRHSLRRPEDHCPSCGIRLPDIGLCYAPGFDKCLDCGATQPALLPGGERPRPYCHRCGVRLHNPEPPQT